MTRRLLLEVEEGAFVAITSLPKLDLSEKPKLETVTLACGHCSQLSSVGELDFRGLTELKEVYLNFMLIYMGDYEQANLDACGIEEVTSEVRTPYYVVAAVVVSSRW